MNQVDRLTNSWLGRCLLAALFWTLLSVFFSLPHLAAGKGLQSMREVFAWCWSWGLIAPFILAFDRRLPFSGRQIARRISSHLVAGVLFTAAYHYVNFVAMAAFGIGPWEAWRISRSFALWTFNDALWSWFFYWVIVAAIQAHGYYRR